MIVSIYIYLEDVSIEGNIIDIWYNDDNYNIDEIKPYLRSLSTMTKDEMEEMHKLLSPKGSAIYNKTGIAIPLNHRGSFVEYSYMSNVINYLNKHQFDFRGLIPKKLAIELNQEDYDRKFRILS